jgi:uncharacterized protein YceK
MSMLRRFAKAREITIDELVAEKPQQVKIGLVFLAPCCYILPRGSRIGAGMKRISLVVILVALSSSGCGTVCNLAGGVLHPDSEPRIYGGVIRDFEIIDKVVSKPEPLLHPQADSSLGNGQGAAYLLAAIIGVAAVEPVVSLVADTLTLPITIPLQNRRIAKQEDKSADSTPPVANSLQTH